MIENITIDEIEETFIYVDFEVVRRNLEQDTLMYARKNKKDGIADGDLMFKDDFKPTLNRFLDRYFNELYKPLLPYLKEGTEALLNHEVTWNENNIYGFQLNNDLCWRGKGNGKTSKDIISSALDLAVDAKMLSRWLNKSSNFDTNMENLEAAQLDLNLNTSIRNAVITEEILPTMI